MTCRETRSFIVVGLVFGTVAFLPLLNSGVWLSLGIDLAMYTVLATAWTLFSGPTHYISLATAAFFGLGMYMIGGGVELLPFPVLVLLAAIVGAALSAIIGLATLRISGVYFVIFTLGLAELIRQIVTWVQTTMGTSSGLYVLTGITEPMIYWQLLVLAALVYLIGWWIGRSRLGDICHDAVGQRRPPEPLRYLVTGEFHCSASRLPDLIGVFESKVGIVAQSAVDLGQIVRP